MLVCPSTRLAKNRIVGLLPVEYLSYKPRHMERNHSLKHSVESCSEPSAAHVSVQNEANKCVLRHLETIDRTEVGNDNILKIFCMLHEESKAFKHRLRPNKLRWNDH